MHLPNQAKPVKRKRIYSVGSGPVSLLRLSDEGDEMDDNDDDDSYGEGDDVEGDEFTEGYEDYDE